MLVLGSLLLSQLNSYSHSGVGRGNARDNKPYERALFWISKLLFGKSSLTTIEIPLRKM